MSNFKQISSEAGQRINVFSRYPFFPLAVVLMLGILAGYYVNDHIAGWIVLIIAFALLILAVIVRRLSVLHVIIYVLVFISGFVAIGFAIPHEQNLPSTRAVFSGVVVSTPRVREKTTQAEVRIFAWIDSGKVKPLDSRVLVYFRTGKVASQFAYGDSVVFSAKLRRVRNLGNPYEFDYKSYLKRKGIYYSAFVDTGNVKLIGYNGGNRIILWASRMRDRLLKIYRFYGIKGTEYNVLAALTLGYRQALDRDTLRKFSRAGAMHILAVSGLHVGILFGVLMLLLRKLFRTRWKWFAAGVILFVLWSFALITGFSPSVRRSAFMFSVIILSLVLHHSPNIYNSLAASAFFLLLFFPADLFSVGFWLSYLAVVSIVAVYPLVNNLLHLPWPFNRLWSLVSVSLAAQVGTMPLSLYVFHQFPNYFLITNLFAIPLAAVILYLALFLFAIANFSSIAYITGRLLAFFTHLLLIAINTTEDLPGATSSHVFITFIQMLVAYISVICVILFFVSRKKRYLLALLSNVLIFFGVNIYNHYRLVIPPRMIVYNIPGHTVVNFISPSTNVLVTDTGVNSQIIENNILPYWKYAHARNAKQVFLRDTTHLSLEELILDGRAISFINKKILILTDRDVMDQQTHRKLDVDYLLLANNVYTKIREVSEFFNFKQIIFASSCKEWRTVRWGTEADSLNVPAHDVIRQGAFTQKINYYD